MAVSRDIGFGYWTPDGGAPRIEYALAVMEEICARAVEGLYRFRHGGVEVGGVLFGEAEGEVVRILAFRPLECEHAFGPRFVLSDRDRANLKNLLHAGQSDAELHGLTAVGWYHSHTRSGIELSPRDLEIYDSYFPLRWQVALVMCPENYHAGRAGFFVRGRDNVVHAGASHGEFAVRPNRQPNFTPEEPEQEPGGEAPGGESAPAQEPATPAKSSPWILDEKATDAAPAVESPLPGFALPRPRPFRKWAAMLTVMLLAGAVVFGAARYWQASAPPEPLALWVADMGGQLLIEWDQKARPIRTAESATLEIQDGKEHTEIQIDGARLRDGSVDYVRRSDIVDVRLRVRAAGREVEEFIRFVGPPVSRGQTPEEAEALRRTEALKAEIADLRGRLEAQDASRRRLHSARAKRDR
ncbi:MAG TPA: hypothetical protein VF767_02630 [Bryobacteraceae bacterium]